MNIVVRQSQERLLHQKVHAFEILAITKMLPK